MDKNDKIANPFWGDGEDKDFGKVAIEYAAGEDILFDQELVLFECLVNQAHVVMLYRRKIIKKTVASKLFSVLEEIKKLYSQGKFKLKSELEDVHGNVEQYLIEKYGLEVGGYLRLGIARNDQIYTDTRMWMRDHILAIAKQLVSLIGVLGKTADKYVYAVMPGYTHLRISQPITYGHYLAAKAYHFYDDLCNILSSYEIVNICPLGIFEMAGTHLPIDRKLTAKLLGFVGITPNSLYTANQRGELEAKLLADMTQLALHIRRTMSEIIVFSSHEFGFFQVDNLYTTGGTAQPNLQNPDTLEVIRANMAKVTSALVETVMIMDMLLSGFNRDTQQTKPTLMKTLLLMEKTIPVVSGILGSLLPNIKKMEKRADQNFATAPDIAVQISVKGGVSFREAYKVVKTIIKKGYLENNFQKLTSSLVAEVSYAVLGKKINISQKDICAVATAKSCVLARKSSGGPQPLEVRKMVQNICKKMNKIEKNIKGKEKKIASALRLLKNEVNSVRSVNKTA